MLNEKQERFCKEYVIDLNGKQAAIRSGYSEKSGEKYYVYLLINPTTGLIFYIGKGKGKRVSHHYKAYINGNGINEAKNKHIHEVVKSGLKPIEFIFEDNLSEKEAFSLERNLILRLSDYGITNITNGVLDEVERYKILAQIDVDRIIPYGVWERKRKPTELEKQMYFSVLNGLKEIAINGFSTTFSIQQSLING